MAISRPGESLASRPLNFFWLVDCSGSMYGEKIGTVNNAIRECLPEMREVAQDNPSATLQVRTMMFSTGANWVNAAATPIDEFEWFDLDADGLTDMGEAFKLLAAELDSPPMPSRALPPVIVLLSDGQPTDDYKRPLEELMKLPWARKAVRIAISIGQGADTAVLEAFTGNRELVLQANNATTLVRLIKWASTNLVSNVSSPASQRKTEEETSSTVNPLVDVDTIPDTDEQLPTDDSNVDVEDVW